VQKTGVGQLLIALSGVIGGLLYSVDWGHSSQLLVRRFRHKVSRIEGVKPVTRYKLPIINTPKCSY
jgi:hypothetical protein